MSTAAAPFPCAPLQVIRADHLNSYLLAIGSMKFCFASSKITILPCIVSHRALFHGYGCVMAKWVWRTQTWQG